MYDEYWQVSERDDAASEPQTYTKFIDDMFE